MLANHDIKYEVNTFRSQVFAARHGVGITYFRAEDKPRSEPLHARTDLPAQKLEWFQRHDRERGDLYGMLPLIVGMPVAMSDHIDRSLDDRI